MNTTQKLVEGIVHLTGGISTQSAALAHSIRSLPPEDALQVIALLLEAPADGWSEGSEVLALIGRVLIDPAFETVTQELGRMATLMQTRVVELFLTDGPAAQEYELDAAQRADAKLFVEPLGRLKTAARLTTDPDELARFAITSNASVVREVLLNPRLTESLVVRIASRRPARHEPLREIALSNRWGVLAEVRRALVFNPYTPPVISCKLVPLVSDADQKMLSADPNVHDAVKRLAGMMLDRV